MLIKINPDNTVSIVSLAEGAKKPDWVVEYSEAIPKAKRLLWDNGKVIADIQAEKEAKLIEINNAFDKEMYIISSKYPDAEKLSWDKQEKEARAYLIDSTSPTPMLDAIATARDIDKTTLARKIVEKADAYSVAVGQAIGKRQALEDAINAATTLEELEAVKW